MADRLRGKVALITGAGSGIGAATASLFAREGAAVALTDLARAGLDLVAAEAAKAGSQTLVMTGDVTKRADTERLVDETLKRFGRVDVLVNSAGVSARNAPPDWDWERVWDFVMAVNMKGTFLMCQAVFDQMVKQRGGSIVNLSSIYGLVGRPREIGSGLDPYLHSKGGVVQLTRDMAVHFARDGVRVNALCPGFVYTPLTKRLTDDPESLRLLIDKHPMGRLGQPAEIAAAALFLASDEASFVTGVCLPVDGGYTAQ
ncbi:MAG TPA: SDR family oxidoreductase [Candidatus Methylomirabilis sp.]|nr:SDR family oxidoreductase [Candidatus Methylomirabilis sp.]